MEPCAGAPPGADPGPGPLRRRGGRPRPPVRARGGPRGLPDALRRARRPSTGMDADLRLLAGDALYALGLSRLAERGDLDAVAELSDLISLTARAHAEGTPERAEALWRATAEALSERGGAGALATWRDCLPPRPRDTRSHVDSIVPSALNGSAHSLHGLRLPQEQEPPQVPLHRRSRHAGRLRGRDGHPPRRHDRRRPGGGRHRHRRVRACRRSASRSARCSRTRTPDTLAGRRPRARTSTTRPTCPG